MQIRLRTLVIIMTLAPPVLAGAWLVIAPKLGYPFLVCALVASWFLLVLGLGFATWIMVRSS